MLVGQREPAAVAAEVALRSTRAAMAGLTEGEAQLAVECAFNGPDRRVTAKAGRRIAADARARNWLDLQDLVDECLALAAARGFKVVDERVVEAVTAPQGRAGAGRRPGGPKAAAPSDEAVAAALGGGAPRSAAAAG